MADTVVMLEVLQWDKFQHYQERWPPWIKNYNSLLAKESYLNLSGHRRAVLHGIWLAYSMSHGELAHDTATLSRRLSLRVTTRDLEALNHAGFIAPVASKALAPRARSGEAEADKEKEREKTPPNPPAPAARKRDIVWDFVVTIEGEPLTRYRAARGRIVADLSQLLLLGDVLPDLQLTELERRHRALASEWGDSKATARALVQHWERAGRIADGTYVNGRNGARSKGVVAGGTDRYAEYTRA